MEKYENPVMEVEEIKDDVRTISIGGCTCSVLSYGGTCSDTGGGR